LFFAQASNLMWQVELGEPNACGNTFSLLGQKLHCVMRWIIHYFDAEATDILRL
jgi:hypothetical protein